MTLPRQEVEFTLEMAKQNCSVMMPAHVALALCERWLAVEDAPVMDIYEMSDGRIVSDAPGRLSGKLVRLVVEE